jgi:hypothetical protein
LALAWAVYLKRGSKQQFLSGSSKPRDCAFAGKAGRAHGWNMKRNSIVSLLIATLACAMQPAGAQSAAHGQHLADAAYSSVNESQLVRQVQVALQKAGYNVGNTDGKYTADTRAAVSRFERDKSLPETGTITPAVLQALGLS